MRKIVYLFTIILSVLVLIGCTTREPAEVEGEDSYYTVTFDSRGGTEIESVEIFSGNTIPLLSSAPRLDNFIFTGWYKSLEIIEINRWIFDTDRVTSDITLYAGWIPDDTVDPTATLTYELVNGSYSVTGVGDETVIIIPETYNELPVTAISGSAFARKHIISVILPDSITEIGLNAFNNCSDLEEVYISSNSELTTIRNNAFSGNSSLKSFYFPESLINLGDNVFNNCGSIEEFIVSESNSKYSSINGHLIEKSTNILLRGSNNSEIPNGIVEIEVSAFSYSNLETITIPESVTIIGNYAFDDASSLKEIVVDENNKNYASHDGILYDIAKTEIIKVPENITGDIELPNTLIEIPMMAFDGRTSITSIFIPIGALAEISVNSFRNTNLVIKYEGDQTSWNEIDISSYWGGDELEIEFNAKIEAEVKNSTLIVYFSRTGNTEDIANYISNNISADVVEIIPNVPYVENYTELLTVASNELSTNARPAISSETLNKINMDNYQNVFIGYPIWHGVEPMIIRTFIDTYQTLNEKSVYLFSTSGSSRPDGSYTNISNQIRKEISGTIHFNSSSLSSAETRINTWMEGLDIMEYNRIKLSFNNQEVFMTLNNNSATKDLVNRLKSGDISLEFSDYAGAEKIAYPTPRLDVSSEAGCTPVSGDVTIYIPWGNIAIFYVSRGQSDDLLHLGKIEGNGIDLLREMSGNFTVTLSLA